MPPELNTFTAYDTSAVQILSEAAAFGTGKKEEFLATGRLPLRIISPGWGTSAHYNEQVLREAAQNGIFAAGTKMYWDHPTIAERTQRPERSLRDLAAVFEEAGRWDPQGPKGAGIYTVANVFAPYREAVWEMARHIGPSIRAFGNTYFGEAEGKQGPIVESIIAAESVDFVTAPGRGGEIIQLFEAARPAANNTQGFGAQGASTSTPPSAGENTVDLQEALAQIAAKDRELLEARGQVTTLTTERDTAVTERDQARGDVRRLQEAGVLREAREAVAEALKPVSNLPDITKTRLTEAVAFNPPVTDKGELDKPKLMTSLEEAVKAEAQYITSLTGGGQVHGLGGGNSGGAGDQTARLEEAMRGLGLSEEEAKAAAIGRA
jgi:hypothetical protein